MRKLFTYLFTLMIICTFSISAHAHQFTVRDLSSSSYVFNPLTF